MNSLEIFNKHKETKPSIVTIGTFDGIHEGHTSLLTNMINNKNRVKKMSSNAILYYNKNLSYEKNYKRALDVMLKVYNKKL